MNIIFMGTPDFAVESLKSLYEAGYNIVAVVSQPDKPSGRGMKLLATPTKEFAVERGIKVYQPEKIKNNEEFIDELKKMEPDVMVVVAYGKILPKEILEIPKYGCINVHGSLLPLYRGAAPIQWSIINGDSETGITTMYMDAGMDTGDMLLKESIKIEDNDTYGSLYEKLKKLGGKSIVKTLKLLEEGKISREKQSNEYTMAPMIFKENCKIDWTNSAFDIRNLVRGVNPAPIAWTMLNDKIYKIWNCEIIDENALDENLKNEIEIKNEMPIKELFTDERIAGKVILSNSKVGLIILTGENLISIKEIQAPNAKKMNILDYLRGNNIDVGSIMK